MPFIVSRVSVPITREQETELKAWMGRAIELVPGKSEDYLLLDFQDSCRLWLRGDNSKPAAYIEAAIFGKPSIFDLLQTHPFTPCFSGGG